MSIFWIWLTGLVFALLHSLPATTGMKKYMHRRGIGMQAYRLAYSILALILTSLWLLFVYALPDSPLYHLTGWIHASLVALQLAGLGVVLLSFRAFDAAIFLGLRPMPDEGEPFHETGIYRLVRHPMYSGFILVLLASPIQTVNSLNLALVICLYFVIGSVFEERRMLAERPAYTDYRQRVGAFIPKFRHKNNTVD
ncbi:MAG TPA: isoprenylcysteine carboxylmethyltransferase family protein [Mariprofundaceae bacterium]|nr:isoprenylcysteine carboxylmethyltransferase family protein [Mariprofundaceae bacterium]